MSAAEIQVQRLRAARVCTVRSDPGKVVLQMTGHGETYFLLDIDELTALAARLSADAQLLSAAPANSDQAS
ncbi:MAG: hypothetical protein L0I29_16725 [Hyphomicrobiales bacterium]|nr:hypothetical protein [Hyphomicrobiales bacterium]